MQRPRIRRPIVAAHGCAHVPGGLLYPVLPAAYLVVVTVALIVVPYDISGAFLLAPVLAAVNMPLVLRAQRTETNPLVRRLIPIGLLAACVVGVTRLQITTWWYGTYGGLPDPARYHSQGAEQAARFWHGDFTMPSTIFGTEFTDLSTGILYTLTGPTVFGGYLCYSCLAFWGLYLCYRSFRTALPDADHRRYARLVLFLPSSLFWSCAIGKEPLVMLGIGSALLGAARMLTGTPRAVLPLLSGLCLAGAVRPHITVLMITAMFAAVAMRRSRKQGPMVPVTRSLGLAAILAAGVLATGPLATLISAEEINLETIDQELDKTAKNYSNEGGSGFSADVVKHPLDFPGAVITVLLRPFPWEADSLFTLLAAGEGVLLAGLVVASWRRWAPVPRMLRDSSYLVLCLAALPMYVIVLSAFGNFGTLVRERLMMLPLVLVFLCLPRPSAASASSVPSGRDSRHPLEGRRGTALSAPAN